MINYGNVYRKEKMGVIVQKDQDKNADLTQRITADLRNRARMQAKMSDPDLVEDSDYAKDLKTTSKFGWFWPVLIILAAISLIFIKFF